MLLGDWIALGLLALAGLYVALRHRLGGRALPRRAGRDEGAGEPPAPPTPSAAREAAAAALLRGHGYAIVDVGSTAAVVTRVDGRARVRRVRADFLVTRDGKRYVARVRGGAARERSLRRQLLDYVLAYRPDGVLLVDGARGRIRTVEFEAAPVPDPARWWRALAPLLGFAAGAASTYAWLRLR